MKKPINWTDEVYRKQNHSVPCYWDRTRSEKKIENQHGMRLKTLVISKRPRTKWQEDHFLSPKHALLTLNDDLYGTRSRKKQVTMLSARKGDKEGHFKDTVCDEMFKITLGVWFRRRSDSQTIKVEKLLDDMVECQGQMSLNGLTVTEDRGYGSIGLLKSLIGRRIGGVIVIPEHLLRCHPFLGVPHFTPESADADFDYLYHETDDRSE